MSHLSESLVRKDIKLKERHEHSGEGRELYLVSRVELSSISSTTILLQTENLYEDFIYFCNVCWLSQGDMLQRVHILREEIATS